MKGVGVGLYVGVIHIRQYLKPLRTWNRKIGTGGKARNTSALVGQSRAIGKRSWIQPEARREMIIWVTDSKTRKRRRVHSVKSHDSKWSCELRTRRHSMFGFTSMLGKPHHHELTMERGSGHENHGHGWLSWSLGSQTKMGWCPEKNLGRGVLRDEENYW